MTQSFDTLYLVNLNNSEIKHITYNIYNKLLIIATIISIRLM